ncbi:hypothetical protein JCM3766R1_004059 [Sporobolomyces carnicolor]
MSLTDQQVINGFHTLVQDSLAQARGEGLLTDDQLASADAAVQVAAPSLALFFAALGSTPTPRGGRVCGPSISSPDRSFVLTSDNCPPSFANAFALWQSTVGPIQELASDGDQRHDLALVLCDHEPVSNRIDLGVAKLASELKAIGLEILQRRTFQLRFQTDLNVALGSAVRPRSPHIDATKTATFEPPPMYSEGRPTSDTKRAYSSIEDEERRYLAAGRGAGMRTTNVVESTVTGEQESNLSVIRETLYSAFADAIVDTPSILGQLARGLAAQAFFASTCLAIVEVALTRVEQDGVRVVQMGRGVPKVVGVDETPPHLRPFLSRLVELSQALQEIARIDDETAIRRACRETERGDDDDDDVAPNSSPLMDRLKRRLAEGVSLEESRDGRDEQELRTLGNAINEMALGMTSLPAFQERQSEAFKVLVAVTSL